MRGEHSGVFGVSWASGGSAPRARGTHHPVDVCLSHTTDQPRVRGEHQSRHPFVGADQPRVRGEHYQTVTRLPIPPDQPRVRGEHPAQRVGQGHGPDQPRVREEHYSPPAPAGTITGSAPRARGTQTYRLPFDVTDRISPACAGNTTTSTRPGSRDPDQPRVRGEHGNTSEPIRGIAGSAPRALGNTAELARRVRREADQPRVRGEHECLRCRLASIVGSAPRARGTLSTACCIR